MKAFFLLMAFVLAVPVAAADVQVIANPAVGVTEIAADDLKDIFLGAKTTLDGSPVQPVFEQSGATHDTFLKAFVGKSDAALRNHFKTLVFTGKGTQPKAFATDAEVVKYVAATRGAIGYVSAAADTAGTRKLRIK